VYAKHYKKQIVLFAPGYVFLTPKVSLLLQCLYNSPAASPEASGSNKFRHPSPFGSGFLQQQKLLAKNEQSQKEQFLPYNARIIRYQ